MWPINFNRLALIVLSISLSNLRLFILLSMLLLVRSYIQLTCSTILQDHILKLFRIRCSVLFGSRFRSHIAPHSHTYTLMNCFLILLSIPYHWSINMFSHSWMLTLPVWFGSYFHDAPAILVIWAALNAQLFKLLHPFKLQISRIAINPADSILFIIININKLILL